MTLLEMAKKMEDLIIRLHPLDHPDCKTCQEINDILFKFDDLKKRLEEQKTFFRGV